LEQESSITSDKAKSLLNDYIHAVVSRYRGKIPWWDVVNEAIDDSNNNSHPMSIMNGLLVRKEIIYSV
jgi:GH35 family endo-1,4-beta-xylanase